MAVKKNLFDDGVKDQMIQRVMLLKEDTQPHWGRLTAAEMLRHLADVLKATRTNTGNGKSTTLKQALSRFVILHVLPQLPKGAKAPKTLDVKLNNITQLELEQERNNFIEELDLYCSETNRFTVNHPYFGNMSHRQWGITTWMHLDHHFRQFGQ